MIHIPLTSVIFLSFFFNRKEFITLIKDKHAHRFKSKVFFQIILHRAKKCRVRSLCAYLSNHSNGVNYFLFKFSCINLGQNLFYFYLSEMTISLHDMLVYHNESCTFLALTLNAKWKYFTQHSWKSKCFFASNSVFQLWKLVEARFAHFFANCECKLSVDKNPLNKLVKHFFWSIHLQLLE